ncbi:MAG: branched-chain amino acid ABC transporter permease [Deltaproteobacteria bacterium]|nr:branched-chain amino acid ABC transporter permease [Deltaproteobacteria bacterium]
MQLLNGFVWGWLLALISIGLTLIYGQLEIINVAHGTMYTIGAVTTFYTFILFKSWSYALIISPLFMGILALFIYLSTIRFVVGGSPITTVIIAYGILFILEQLTLLIFGGVPRTIPNPIPQSITLFKGISYPLYRIFCAGFSIVVITLLLTFLKKTKLGLWIRATKQDHETAAAMGISVPFVFMFIFVLGSALAALGGVLAAPITGVTFDMGNNIVIDAFIVVIMAGFGSIPGTIVAALIIEMVIGLSAAFVNPVIAKVVGLAVMLIALYIRPQGIFGEE